MNSDDVYNGKVTYISKIPDNEKKFYVEIAIPYSENIKYGYSANIKIKNESSDSSIIIPYEAINVDQNTGKYYVIKAEYKEYYEKEQITEDMKNYIDIGIININGAEVKYGLEEGTKILYWK